MNRGAGSSCQTLRPHLLFWRCSDGVARAELSWWPAHQIRAAASHQFKPIQKFLIALDGSDTTRKGVEMIVASPLFTGLPCHIVVAGADTRESRAQIQWAHEKLAEDGFEVHSSLRPKCY